MSMPQSPSGQGSGQASASDINSTLQGIVRQLAAWVMAFQGRSVYGSFTLAASATTTVTQPAVKANSVVTLSATNAAAATLMGSAKALYVSALTPGASFTVTTASGGAAAGSETFMYAVQSP